MLLRAASFGVLALYAVAIRNPSVVIGAPLAADDALAGDEDADDALRAGVGGGGAGAPGGSAKDRPRSRSSSRPGLVNGLHESMTPEERASHAAHRADLSRRIQERRKKSREQIKERNRLADEAAAKEGLSAEAKTTKERAQAQSQSQGHEVPKGRRKLDGMSRLNGKIERLSKEEMERIAERAKTAAAGSVRAKKEKKRAKTAAAAEDGDAKASGSASAEKDDEKQPKQRRLKTPAAERDAASDERNFDWMRRAGWGGGGTGGSIAGVPNNYDAYEEVGGFADPGDEYDWWSQGYRLLGGFIDCDHGRENSHNWRRRKLNGEYGVDSKYDQNERDLSGSGDGEGYGGCQRWMMWASYVNPNYQGNGYDEYFGDGCGDDGSSACGNLDCHVSGTEWILIGVYRQEFYQWVEQISKHLWAIDAYEYVVALAGLAYMTDYDCWQVGQSGDGSALYAGTRPKEYGNWEMALYTDEYCLELDESSGYTYDDMGMSSYLNLGSKDETGCSYGDGRRLDADGGNSSRKLEDNYNYNGGGGGCGDLEDYWESTQEYTLTNLNEVYDVYKYCTPCMDYPTYQDGYFIGDYGTDDDDIINQCWKFHSHDSFVCEGDCINMAHAQGTILQVDVNGRTFGQSWDGTTTSNPNINSHSSSSSGPSKLDRLKANIFVGFAGIIFVATFLAFAVARGSGRKDRSGKSRSLLTPEERARARRRSRSKGRASSASRGDRSTRTGRSGRSKSRGASSRSKSTGRSTRSRSKRRGESSGRSTRNQSDDNSPSRKGSTRAKSSSRRSRSSKYMDDF